jgi:hypothetical protein
MRVIKLQQQLQLELIKYVDSATVPLRHCCTLSDEIGTVTQMLAMSIHGTALRNDVGNLQASAVAVVGLRRKVQQLFRRRALKKGLNMLLNPKTFCPAPKAL